MAQQPSPTSITLHPKPSPATANTETPSENPLPGLLQTPAGLALLELQGTINLPAPEDLAADASSPAAGRVSIGRVEFPDYNPDSVTFDPSSTAWMKRAYLFVGQHQRLTGEVKKLPRAVGVVRRRAGEEEQLEIAEIVKYKIVFSSRPEPVGTG